MKFKQMPDDYTGDGLEINIQSIEEAPIGPSTLWAVKRLLPMQKSNAEIAKACWMHSTSDMFRALLDAVDEKIKALEERLKNYADSGG